MSHSPWRHCRLGLMCLAVPVIGIAWWIYVTQTHNGDHASLVEHFLSPFPEFLRSSLLITLVELAFSGAAFLMFIVGLGERGFPKYLNLAMLCFSGLIGSLLLFSLM